MLAPRAFQSEPKLGLSLGPPGLVGGPPVGPTGPSPFPSLCSSALCLSWQPVHCVSPGPQEGCSGQGRTLRCGEPRDLLAACGQQMGLGLSLRIRNLGTSQVLSGIPATLPCQPPDQDQGLQ